MTGRTHASAQSGSVTKASRNVATLGNATPARTTGQSSEAAAIAERKSCRSSGTRPNRAIVAHENARVRTRPS